MKPGSSSAVLPDMQNINLHPTEDELELFVLRRSPEEELEGLESHILACESCVTRLEALEIQIGATRLVLREMQREQLARAASRQGSSWIRLPVPKFSLVAAVATVALGIIVVPALFQRGGPVVQVSLSTYRGAEASIVPEARRLHVHLNASDLTEGSVIVELVDSRGVEVWTGKAAIHDQQVELVVPPIMERGAHFLRLSAGTQPGAESDLLREFAFQVK
jgi:anti-sigma-K factor RskA